MSQLLVYVCVLLERDNKILLAKRANTGFMDGYWSFPGGRLDENESLIQAAAREAGEELGVIIAPEHLSLVHVVHRNNQKLGFYYRVAQWQGDPINNEPNLCSEIGWFCPDTLPEPTNPHAARVIQECKISGTYSYFE